MSPMPHPASYSTLLNARIALWRPGGPEPDAATLAEFTRLRDMDRKDQAYRRAAGLGVATANHHVYGDVRAALNAYL